jgi:hypothetical protein
MFPEITALRARPPADLSMILPEQHSPDVAHWTKQE